MPLEPSRQAGALRAPASMLGAEERDVTEQIERILELIASALRASLACVLWRSRLDSRIATVCIGSEQATRAQQDEWFGLADGESLTARHGYLIASVPALHGRSAALVVRPGSEAPDLDAAAITRAGAQLLGDLFASTNPQIERAQAYEALFQIGTQIQAEEVRAGSIFSLVVERARELLATDVSWLALVDDSYERLSVEVAVGASAPEFLGMWVDVGRGIGGLALQDGRTISVRDAELYGNLMPDVVRIGLRKEGVRSVLCAPMIREGGMVGALYVGVREPIDWGEEATALLSALAAQTAVAIENSRLYHALTEKNATLERTFGIHRMLTDASLSGDGLDEVARKLAQLIDRDLVLSVVSGAPRVVRYSSVGGGPVVVSGDDVLDVSAQSTVAVMAGETSLGWLYALGDGELSRLHRNALEHGGTVIALELVKEQAALEVEWRMQGELLEELLRSAAAPSDGLRARAARAGIDLARPHRVAALMPEGAGGATALLEFTRRTLRLHHAVDGLVARRGERILIALDGEIVVGGVIPQLQARGRAAGTPFACGLSRAHTDFATALREAEAALALAVQRAGTFVSYEQLGPLRFLLDAPDTGEMVAVVSDLLGPLADHDGRRSSALLATLEAYLRSGGHHPTTCECCHIHVSTLKYRLSRITVILGRPLTDPETRFQLSLAFELLAVLRLMGVEPFSAGQRDRGEALPSP